MTSSWKFKRNRLIIIPTIHIGIIIAGIRRSGTFAKFRVETEVSLGFALFGPV